MIGIDSYFHFEQENGIIIAWGYPGIGDGIKIDEKYLANPSQLDFVPLRSQHEDHGPNRQLNYNYWARVSKKSATTEQTEQQSRQEDEPEQCRQDDEELEEGIVGR